MSVAVLGIGANIIAVVDACNQIISRIQLYRHNLAFQDLILQLPLLVSAIESLRAPEYCELLDSSTEKALIRVLEGCLRQLQILENLIKDLTPSNAASKLQRTWKGIRSFGKDTKLREINGILAEYKSTITLYLSTIHAQGPRKAQVSSSEAKPVFDVPQTRLSHFVGREDILERIQNVTKTSAVNPSIAVLTGVGGQGKTQISLEYCYRFSHVFKAVFWIDASSEASVSRSYERILKRISQATVSTNSTENKFLVKDILGGWKEPWLLVFDNYDDSVAFDNIKSFFPTSTSITNSAILITSRQVSNGRLGVHLPLDGLTEAEGLQLLTSRASSTIQHEGDEAEGKKIIQTLGYLPLAIDQAAAYISIRQLPLKLFSDHFEKRKEFILKDTPQSLWEYQKRISNGTHDQLENLSVLTTWELSFDQISGTDDERKSIRDFLVQAAFFSPSNISDTLFSGFFEADSFPGLGWQSLFSTDCSWDSFKFQDVIVGLVNLSLVQRMEITSNQVKFSLHPLVKDWLQLRESPKARQECVAVATTITASMVLGNDAESMSLQKRQELLSHIDACVENGHYHLKNQASIIKYGGFLEGFQTSFATFYGQHDRYLDAERLFRRSLELQKTHLGVESIATLSTMNNLSALYLDLKRLDEAEPILYETLVVKENMLGPEHPRTLNTVNNIGNLLALQLRYDEATQMYERTLEGYQAINGPNHRTVIQSLNNLGEIAMKKGNFFGAEVLFTDGIRRLLVLDGNQEDALVLYLKSNIALLYKLQNRLKEAVTAYIDLVNKRKEVLGPEHSLSLQSMCELADVYQALGQTDLAVEWYREGCASIERIKRGTSTCENTDGEIGKLNSRFQKMASINDEYTAHSAKVSITANSSRARDKILSHTTVDNIDRRYPHILDDSIDRRGPLISDNPSSQTNINVLANLADRSGPPIFDGTVDRHGPSMPDDPGITKRLEPSNPIRPYSSGEIKGLDRAGVMMLQSKRAQQQAQQQAQQIRDIDSQGPKLYTVPDIDRTGLRVCQQAIPHESSIHESLSLHWRSENMLSPKTPPQGSSNINMRSPSQLPSTLTTIDRHGRGLRNVSRHMRQLGKRDAEDDGFPMQSSKITKLAADIDRGGIPRQQFASLEARQQAEQKLLQQQRAQQQAQQQHQQHFDAEPARELPDPGVDRQCQPPSPHNTNEDKVSLLTGSVDHAVDRLGCSHKQHTGIPDSDLEILFKPPAHNDIARRDLSSLQHNGVSNPNPENAPDPALFAGDWQAIDRRTLYIMNNPPEDDFWEQDHSVQIADDGKMATQASLPQVRGIDRMGSIALNYGIGPLSYTRTSMNWE
ncbi:Pfs NB-ARC and TPR domain protein [Rutstroemia sp. NJR-2017a BVV2]|nr:Pfs NB-ARC and TPR domain protein [Rutstroemia sp. NJR-2017a BVV2]